MEYELPKELMYAATHEWVKIEGDLGIIGLSDFAQHQLGDIVFVELPEIGLILEKDSTAIEIESVKAVGDLIMPLSGEIIEVNTKLEEAPELINTSPYGDGWIIKIKIKRKDELKSLLSIEDYKQVIETEDH